MISIANYQNNSTDKEHVTSDNNDASQIVKIKWLAQWYGEGKKETLIHEIARDFSFQNQNIEIDIEFPHEMAKINSTAIPFNYVVDTIVEMVEQNKWPYDIMLCGADIYRNVGIKLNNQDWGHILTDDLSNSR